MDINLHPGIDGQDEEVPSSVLKDPSYQQYVSDIEKNALKVRKQIITDMQFNNNYASM